MGSIKILFSLLLFLSAPWASALVYPTGTPDATEVYGGTYYNYFTNIFSSETSCYALGRVVGGFRSDGTPICVLPGVSPGFFIPGSLTGDTLRYDGTDWVRNNFLYNNGTAIGIGNQNPQAKLDVSGDVIIHGVMIGRGGGSFPGNTAIGSSALMSNTNGYGNTAIGSNTLSANTTGYFNTAVGEAALASNTTGVYNSSLGRGALAGNTTGTNNTAIGFAALASNSSTFQNTAVGGYALNVSTGPYNTAVGGFSLAYNTSGGYNVGIGEESMYNNTIGFYNSALGHRSLYSNTTGSNNSSVGYNALFSNTTGNYNSTFGYNSLYSNITGGFNVSFGYNAGSQLTSGDTNIFLGYNTQPNISNTGSHQLNIGNWIYGNNGNIGIGISSPLTSAKLEVAGNIKIIDGTQGSGKVLMSDASGLASWVIPTASSVTATGVIGGFENYVSKFGTGGAGLYSSQIFDNGVSVGIGTASPGAKLEIAGQIKITGGSPGSGEVLMSDASGLATWSSLPLLTDYWSTTGNIGTIPGINFVGTSDNVNVVFKRNNQTGGLLSLGNTSWGVGALQSISSGISNTAEGYFSLSGNTTGSANTSNGAFSLKDNTTGSGNTAEGYFSLGVLNSGNYNTANGYRAGWSNIGSLSGSDNTFLGANSSYSTAVSNATAVGANVSLAQSNTVILGSGANVGIGTATPGAKLEIVGNIKIIDGTQGSGKVLMTDASGLASWQSHVSATATGITGGVENYVSKFGTGGLGLYSSQIFDNGLQVSIGNNTPTSKFEVWSGAISLIHFRGVNNTALGNNAVKYTLTGNANTGIGSESLFTLTTGYSNSAFGYRSLRQNTTGFNNTAIGQEALYNNNGGSWNSAVGYQALYSNVSGINNIAEGPQALFNLSTGNNNIAIGYQSLRLIAGSSVSSNVAIGYQSLFSTTSSNQVAIGYQSLFSNTSGASNVAIGYQSLDTNTTGSNNTAIGDMSLGNTTGSNNTAIGASAGSGNTTGSNNITIGYATQLPTPTGSNQLNIGNWIYGSGGKISIGTPLIGSGGYQMNISGGYVNSASGFCINNICIANWTGIFDAINGQGNYLPKWNLSGTGLIASRISDNGSDIAISSGALQQVLITPANQSEYNQVLISASGGVLKQGLTTREKLRIFAYSNYGPSVANDATIAQTLCFDNSTSNNCKSAGDPSTLTNVPNYNETDPKSYTGGIGEYIPATTTDPGYFISNFTGTYMVVTNYIFTTPSLGTSDNGCNVFPYYSLYNPGSPLPVLERYDNTAPVIFTVDSSTVIQNVYSSTNLSLPPIKTTRVGSQFVSNVFMTPGQKLLITIGVQSCSSRADQSMSLVTNNQRKMTLSITEL